VERDAPVDAHESRRRAGGSIAFYAVGGETPDDVARKVLDDAERWLAESDVEPMTP
jgi:hypothetical protein